MKLINEDLYEAMLQAVKQQGGYSDINNVTVVFNDGERDFRLHGKAVVLKYEYEYECQDRLCVNMNLCLIDSKFHCWDICDYCLDDNEFRKLAVAVGVKNI